MKKVTRSEEETRLAGENLATTLQDGDIVLLSGDLGAGKTTFMKGLAKGFGIQEELTSPTFTLMNVYPVSDHQTVRHVVHIDTYRLQKEQELIDIGAEDYLAKPETISVIEWPEKIPALLAGKLCVPVALTHISPTNREIEILDRTPMPQAE